MTDVMLPTKINPATHFESDCVVITMMTGMNIVAMGWSDFKKVNSKTAVLDPGEVMRFKAVFVLDENNSKKLKIDNPWEFLITTYSGRDVAQPFDLPETIISQWDGRIFEGSCLLLMIREVLIFIHWGSLHQFGYEVVLITRILEFQLQHPSPSQAHPRPLPQAVGERFGAGLWS